MNNTVLQIVNEYSTKIKNDRIFFAPDIPKKELSNAINSYAMGIGEEEALILIDDTVARNAKNGLILTFTSIYVKSFFKRHHVNIMDIRSVSFSKGIINHVIKVNDKEFLETDIDKVTMQFLTEMLITIAERINPEEYGKSEDDAPSPCQFCLETIPKGARICPYCQRKQLNDEEIDQDAFVAIGGYWILIASILLAGIFISWNWYFLIGIGVVALIFLNMKVKKYRRNHDILSIVEKASRGKRFVKYATIGLVVILSVLFFTCPNEVDYKEHLNAKYGLEKHAIGTSFESYHVLSFAETNNIITGDHELYIGILNKFYPLERNR